MSCLTKTLEIKEINYSPVKRLKGSFSPIHWFGGKFYLAKDIISLMPTHCCYVEPFAGGLHVLAQKEPSKIEVANDIDSDLINFLEVLRNSKNQLLESLETLPTSRYLTEKWQGEPLPVDRFERAVRWYYLLRQTIVPANNCKSGWRTGKIKNFAFDYQNSVKRLGEFEKRIHNVSFECLDFRKIIKKYDSADTFFFIDPPYVGREKMYKGGFTEKDHRELAELLRTIKGKALVSYYNDPLITELYKGWNKQEVKAYVGTTVLKEGQKKKIETEVFFMNYKEDSTKIDYEEKELSFQTESIQLKLF